MKITPIKNQLHAVSRTQQFRQENPNVKTLFFPFPAEFWRHCVLSGGSQRRAFPRHETEDMKILNTPIICYSM